MARGYGRLPTPKQCESNPTGLNGVVVYEAVTYPIASARGEDRHSTQAQQEDRLCIPVQCESDLGLNEVVVYDDITYSIASTPCGYLSESAVPR